ncbi:hypothetical protein ACFL1H_06825 [Nanoarchaeota archaeon]
MKTKLYSIFLILLMSLCVVSAMNINLDFNSKDMANMIDESMDLLNEVEDIVVDELKQYDVELNNMFDNKKLPFQSFLTKMISSMKDFYNDIIKTHNDLQTQKMNLALAENEQYQKNDDEKEQSNEEKEIEQEIEEKPREITIVPQQKNNLPVMFKLTDPLKWVYNEKQQKVPYTFFERTVQINYDGESVVLSSTPDGTEMIKVDDQIEIYFENENGENYYANDFSRGHSGRVEKEEPFDLTPWLEEGQNNVTFQFVNLYPPYYSSTAFWIVIETNG